MSVRICWFVRVCVVNVRVYYWWTKSIKPWHISSPNIDSGRRYSWVYTTVVSTLNFSVWNMGQPYLQVESKIKHAVVAQCSMFTYSVSYCFAMFVADIIASKLFLFSMQCFFLLISCWTVCVCFGETLVWCTRCKSQLYVPVMKGPKSFFFKLYMYHLRPFINGTLNCWLVILVEGLILLFWFPKVFLLFAFSLFVSFVCRSGFNFLPKQQSKRPTFWYVALVTSTSIGPYMSRHFISNKFKNLLIKSVSGKLNFLFLLQGQLCTFAWVLSLLGRYFHYV